MNCEEVKFLLIEYIDENLGADTQLEIKNHIDGCEDCRKELDEVRSVFGVMAKYRMEQPDESLRMNFNSMLRSEMKELKKEEDRTEFPVHRTLHFNWSSPLVRIAASVLLLTAGAWIGILIKTGMDMRQSGQLSELKNEMRDMKEMLMFTMLNGESASQRIKAVNFSSEIPYPNEKVIRALVSTLNNDKNVNVRLAAAYSLEKFWDLPQVRDSLVVSLDKQSEPIIQIVLINLLTEKNEMKAVKPMQEIISNKNTMREVKDIAEKSLRVLL